MTISEMRRILAERQIQLTRSLGQNFLHDGNQLRRIADAGEIGDRETILEVGPGLGPLTELLLERAGKVLAIEKDARLVAVLRDRFPTEDKLELLHADALDYLRAEKRVWAEAKLISNLPYSVASPLLVELALGASPPERMVATLQLEVVNRVMSRPDSSDYGLLTLLLGLKYRAVDSFKIGRECFFPAPDVDSGCMILVRRAQPLVASSLEPAFVKLVKAAFSQRRKMMLKLLKAHWPLEALHAAFANAGISLQERAEKVAIEQFAQLVTELESSPYSISARPQ